MAQTSPSWSSKRVAGLCALVPSFVWVVHSVVIVQHSTVEFAQAMKGPERGNWSMQGEVAERGRVMWTQKHFLLIHIMLCKVRKVMSEWSLYYCIYPSHPDIPLCESIPGIDRRIYLKEHSSGCRGALAVRRNWTETGMAWFDSITEPALAPRAVNWHLDVSWMNKTWELWVSGRPGTAGCAHVALEGNNSHGDHLFNRQRENGQIGILPPSIWLNHGTSLLEGFAVPPW